MFITIRAYLIQSTHQFEHIPEERKAILAKMSTYIRQRYQSNQGINLNYICTHNSRRSQFGQVAATLAAEYYSIDQVFSFSGGTEATALHPNAKSTLARIGLKIFSDDKVLNPVHHLFYGMNKYLTCFSKTYDAPGNPIQNFAAVMTCSDADEKCPFIPGADLRIPTTYNDPKASDVSAHTEQTYDATLQQIVTETLYAFSMV